MSAAGAADSSDRQQEQAAVTNIIGAIRANNSRKHSSFGQAASGSQSSGVFILSFFGFGFLILVFQFSFFVSVFSFGFSVLGFWFGLAGSGGRQGGQQTRQAGSRRQAHGTAGKAGRRDSRGKDQEGCEE